MEKIAWLSEFFEKEDPTADFRSARIIADELKTALNKLLKELSETAGATFQKVFGELEAEARKRKVDMTSATRSYKNTKITLTFLRILDKFTLTFPHLSAWRQTYSC